MRLGECLSSFKDSRTALLNGASLLGKDLAYSMNFNPTGCTVIVNWEEAHGKTEGDELLRWYIPDTEATVPGIAISPPPLILQGTIRLVVPTPGEAFSLIIPIDDYDLESIRFQLLLKAEFGFASNQEVFGNRRAVGVNLRDHGNNFLYAAQYRFPGDATTPYSPKFQRQPHDTVDPTPELTNLTAHLAHKPCHIKFRTRLLYDQYTNRIVQTDHHITYFITVSSYASHTIDPGKSSVPSSEIQRIGSVGEGCMEDYNGESESEVGWGSSEEGEGGEEEGEEEEGGDEEEGEEETGEDREEEEMNSDDDDALSVVEDNESVVSTEAKATN
ncbi:hypothetical protein DFP72DRAFT_1125322 [Ephemerocybe angulata]|uniref:Uncharacterized protein n=1 Tax=Ephemerocybe angulata TaxID=980116 RepID=A0A8H6M4Q1_9AGAR|nr:hypothetical protein DFP72DRAFT_1125322 [Tulosesus angulatus]